MDRFDINVAHDEMEIHYHGLMRLAGLFGPVMRSRGADGQHGAVAWLNVLSAYAMVNNPELGTYSASQAAALSLSQCLRAEMTHGGVRVVNAFLGPIEDEWHQLALPPKLDPALKDSNIALPSPCLPFTFCDAENSLFASSLNSSTNSIIFFLNGTVTLIH